MRSPLIDYTFSEPRACIPARTGKDRVEDGGPSAIADVEVSFDACYRQHRVSILAVVMALRGPRVDAEAVVQEAFLRAHARWAEVGRLDHPHWWVQRVALNLATSRLRRLGTEARALARHGAPDASGFTSGFEDAQRFWQLVRRLPTRQAEVVALHYAGELSIAAIAGLLGVAEGTVKAHLYSAPRTTAPDGRRGGIAVNDLESIARRAGADLRAEARARFDAHDDRTAAAAPRTGRRPLHAVALLTLLGVAAWGVAVAWPEPAPRAPAIEPIGPGDDGLLPLPEVGSATAGHLEDGTPVFVSQPEAGEIVVVGAADHHLGDRLVAFCKTSGWFEEPYHGSRYNGWGEWTGGPSPSGLSPYRFEVVEGPVRAGVRVTGGPDTPSERDAQYEHEQSQRGPSCEPGQGQATDAIAHRPPDEVPVVGPDQVPQDRWGWVRLEVAGTVREPRLCTPGEDCNPGYPLPTSAAAPGDERLTRSRATWLARRDDAGTVQLRWPGHPYDRRLELLEPVEAGDQLRAPRHGAAVPGHLDDDTPVFVTRTRDGELFVLDATSPADPVDLVGYCPRDGLFADANGGRWDLTGRWVAGRVGGDLSSYRFVTYDGLDRTVVQTIGEDRSPPFRTGPEGASDATAKVGCDDLQRHDPTRVAELGLRPATAGAPDS